LKLNYGNRCDFPVKSHEKSQDDLKASPRIGSTIIGIFLPPNKLLHVSRVLSKGDTKITLGITASQIFLAFRHCSTPFFVIWQSRRLGLYLTSNKKF